MRTHAGALPPSFVQYPVPRALPHPNSSAPAHPILDALRNRFARVSATHGPPSIAVNCCFPCRLPRSVLPAHCLLAGTIATDTDIRYDIGEQRGRFPPPYVSLVRNQHSVSVCCPQVLLSLGADPLRCCCLRLGLRSARRAGHVRVAVLLLVSFALSCQFALRLL